MTEAFLLGAGFSVAVDPLTMPDTNELGRKAVELLRSMHLASIEHHSSVCDGLSCDRRILIDGEPPGGSFEVWLSRLAEDQPYRYPHENATAASLYQQLSSAVADSILEATRRCCRQDVPTAAEWFGPLVELWHERRADVLTLNYDTLVEARFDALELVNTPYLQAISYRDLGSHALPEAGVIDGGSAGPPPETFRYVKLHGSVHWYWDPVTRSADSMVDVGLPSRWCDQDAVRSDPEQLVPGRRPVVVPPTSSKSTFFSNPVVRQMWRDAFEAVRSADRLILIGYSLPTYDLLVGSLLEDAARQRGGLSATVVDLAPDGVSARLESLGYSVSESFSSVQAFVDAYSSRAARSAEGHP
jgi:hypothetical protein